MSPRKNAPQFVTLVQGKAVVIDTSSLLVSGMALLNELPPCNLILPSIVVKELEDKRTHPTVGFLAREWLRLLESLRTQYGEQLSSGVPLPGAEGVTVQVEPNHSTQQHLPRHLQDGSHDSTILAVADNLQKEDQSREVVLLSNDTPMRLHATLDLKLQAVEFNATVAAGAEPFDGRVRVPLSEEEYLSTDKIVANHGVRFERMVMQKLKNVPSHAYVTVEMEGNTKPVQDYLYDTGALRALERRQRASGITTRTLEQDIAMSYLYASPEELPLVSIGGGAGTGKTLLSVAVGLEELKRGTYQRVIVFRSLHEMGQGQELGFLPGDVTEKMEAWGGAVFDALDVIATSGGPRRGKTPTGDQLKAEVKKLRDMIEISPITYLRGRSLSNSYIVLDEAQNFSRSELLNILSRAGEGTKMVLCFDALQVDNKYLQSGNKADIWSVIEDLRQEPLFAHITLMRTERSKVAELSARLLRGDK